MITADESGIVNRHYVTVLLLLALVLQLKATGPECSDVEKPWKCNTVEICYSDPQKCNGVNDCGDFTDEANCTSVGVTKHLIIYNNRSNQANLAWLITPVVLGIGLLYAVYKCFKEGLCHIRRMQRAQEVHGSYFALDQVSFYSMSPLQRTTLGSPGHHLMVVHNHHFSLTMSDPLPPPPEEDEGVPDELTPPPTYAESVHPGISNAGFAPIPQEDPDLPPYKERATPPPPITPPPAFTPRCRASSVSSYASPTSPLHHGITSTSPMSRVLPPPLSLQSLSTTSTPASPSSTSLPPTSPRVFATSSHLPPMSPRLPLLSPRLPPPPPSPRRPVSMPTLQQLAHSSTQSTVPRPEHPSGS